MSPWQLLLQKWRKSHFLRFGLPFLTLVVGSSFLTVDFQRIKYDAQSAKRGKRLLEEHGLSKRVDLKQEADLAAESAKQFEWRNIRGPRAYEDSSEFLSLREAQERNVKEAKERAEKALLEKESQAN